MEPAFQVCDTKTVLNRIPFKDLDEWVNEPLDTYKKLGTERFLEKIIKALELYRIKYDVISSEKAINEKYPMDEVIEKLRNNGYVYEKEGATWLASSKLYDENDHVLIKSDGTHTYLLPDISYHIDKIERGYDEG